MGSALTAPQSAAPGAWAQAKVWMQSALSALQSLYFSERSSAMPVLWVRMPWCAWRLWRLRDQLLQRTLSVGTVDSFHGQERDIIAITLTRSNPQGEIGFLSDIRRMNVGMTRARRKLLLVGDSSTLCRHPFFGELLAYVKGVGGYRTAHEMGK
jgi:hypothetical protein